MIPVRSYELGSVKGTVEEDEKNNIPLLKASSSICTSTHGSRGKNMETLIALNHPDNLTQESSMEEGEIKEGTSRDPIVISSEDDSNVLVKSEQFDTVEKEGDDTRNPAGVSDDIR